MKNELTFNNEQEKRAYWEKQLKASDGKITVSNSYYIAIACHELGFNLTACELDSEYYDAALKRFKQQTDKL